MMHFISRGQVTEADPLAFKISTFFSLTDSDVYLLINNLESLVWIEYR